MAKKKEKRGVGRPRKAVKEINPQRLQSRWDEESWSLLERAAAAAGCESVVEWARPRLIKTAKRELGKG